MIFLAVLFVCLLAFLTWRNLVWGVYALLALLPSYLIRFTIGILPFTLLEVSILTVAIVWFIKMPHRQIYTASRAKQLCMKSGALTVWWYLTLLFIASATVAAFVSPARIGALGIWKAYFAEPLIFFAVFISTVRTPRQIRTVFDFLFVGIAIAAVVSIIQKFTGWWIPNPFWQAEITRRVTSIYSYPNAFPLLVAPLLPLIIYQIRAHSRMIARSAYVLLIIAVLLGIMFAKSDGAIAGLAVAALATGLWHKQTRVYTVVGALLIMFVIIFTPQFQTAFASRFLFQDVSGQLRLSMWQETWDMLKAHPWQGGGLANYQSAILPFHRLQWAEIYLYPHNIFLNFWTETGIFGLISFSALTAYFLIRAIKQRHARRFILYKILAISMLILLIHGMVDVPYFKNDLAIMFWLLIAVMVTEERLYMTRAGEPLE